MKKAVLLLLAVLMAAFTFTGCTGSPEAASDDSMTETEAVAGLPEGVLYMLQDAPKLFSIPENGEWNYQRIEPLGEGISVAEGDVLTLEMSGTSDKNISLIKTFLVSQGSNGSDWNVISGYLDAYGPIVSGEAFSFSTDIPVTASASNDNIKISIYVEFDAVDSKPTLVLDSMTLKMKDAE